MVSRSKAHSVRMGRVGAEEYAECTHLGIQEALGSVVLGGRSGTQVHTAKHWCSSVFSLGDQSCQGQLPSEPLTHLYPFGDMPGGTKV